MTQIILWTVGIAIAMLVILLGMFGLVSAFSTHPTTAATTTSSQ